MTARLGLAVLFTFLAAAFLGVCGAKKSEILIGTIGLVSTLHLGSINPLLTFIKIRCRLGCFHFDKFLTPILWSTSGQGCTATRGWKWTPLKIVI